jgi:hypothetical protein
MVTCGEGCSFSSRAVLPRFSSGVRSNLCWSERSEREREKGGDDDSDSQRLWRHISVVCGTIGKLALCSSLRRGCCVQSSRVFEVVRYTNSYNRRSVPALPYPRRLQRHSALSHTLSGFFISTSNKRRKQTRRKEIRIIRSTRYLAKVFVVLWFSHCDTWLEGTK